MTGNEGLALRAVTTRDGRRGLLAGNSSSEIISQDRYASFFPGTLPKRRPRPAAAGDPYVRAVREGRVGGQQV